MVINSGSNNITAENWHFALGWRGSAGAREVKSISVITPRVRVDYTVFEMLEDNNLFDNNLISRSVGV